MEQTKKRMTTLCYAAGQSGGHIIPCLTLAKQHKNEQPETCILFFSSNGTIDQNILKTSTIVDQHIQLPLSHKRSLLRLPLLCMHIGWATVQSFYTLLRSKPSRIISSGGIVAAPVLISGWFLRIPIDLYELNAVPGKAVRALAPLASNLYICFAATKKFLPDAVLVNYPIRFKNSPQTISKKLPHFSSARLTLFVHGGSQGAQFINRQIKKLIETYPDLRTRIQLIHQTGPDTSKDWNAFYKAHGVPAHMFAYEHDIVPYYEQADLIIGRSGAGALFETVHFQKSCITIPLETKHNTHQLDNAHAIVTEHPKLFTLIRQGDDVVRELYQIIKKGTG